MVRTVCSRTAEGIDAAKDGSVVITRVGELVAVFIGVEGYDLDDVRYRTDTEFWKEIERRQRTAKS